MPASSIRLNDMGHIVFKASKTPERNKPFSRHDGDGMHYADTYNRSSLALEFAPEPVPEEPYVPHLISMPNTARSGVPDSPLWKGEDPFASKRGRASRSVSLILHVAVISGILWWSLNVHNPIVQPTREMVFKLFDPQTPPPPVQPVPKPLQGGGGGGEHHIIQPQRGTPPKPLEHFQKMLPPEIARVQKPLLPVPPTIHANLPQNTALPNFGMPKSPQIAVASQGSGSNGFGIGMGGGMGAGQGDGAAAGAGGGFGGGVMNVGGGVSAPEVIHSVDPDFTAQARAADLQGVVSIQLIVDPQGNPQDVHVVKHLGMGLDQKAIEAVRQYKFRPAMYQGHPVAVQMIVDVAFHLH
jgi:protein TonB